MRIESETFHKHGHSRGLETERFHDFLQPLIGPLAKKLGGDVEIRSAAPAYGWCAGFPLVHQRGDLRLHMRRHVQSGK